MTKLQISKPKLPRKRRVPKRLDDGTAPGDHPPTVEDHYRSIYFQTFDVVINCIESRFDQLGYRSYSRLKSLLLKAASKKNFAEDLNFVCDVKDNFERNSLKVQLESLAINIKETTPTLKDVVAYLKKLDKNSWDYFSEVFTLVKLILVVPATNALSERSCSALRRLKTYLQTTMCQDRLNHCMILYVHKELTDALEMTDVGNQFVSNCKDQTRLSRFGRFKSQLSS